MRNGDIINCDTVNEDFAIAILGDLPLRRVVAWIRGHLKPIEVFSEDQICEYTRCYFAPEAVYSDMDLDRWARENGYEKPDPTAGVEDNLDIAGDLTFNYGDEDDE